jgi:hypothetical protein
LSGHLQIPNSRFQIPNDKLQIQSLFNRSITNYKYKASLTAALQATNTKPLYRSITNYKYETSLTAAVQL